MECPSGYCENDVDPPREYRCPECGKNLVGKKETAGQEKQT